MVVAMVLVAANLRPWMFVVSPVLVDIQAAHGLSTAGVASLTALPILCFGTVGLFAPRVAAAAGIERTLAGVLTVVALALVLRVAAPTWALFAGTIVAGAAVAVGNVIVPAFVRSEFTARAGLMIGLYASVLATSSSVGAGAAVPIAEALGQGWRGALGVWALPAGIAATWWVVVAALRRGSASGGQGPRVAVPARLLRDRVAWQVTAFMALQSLNFVAVMTWLPTMHRSLGMSPEGAGAMLSLLILVNIPVTLVVPIVAARASDQRVWASLASLLTAVGILGLIVAPTRAPALWSLVLGTGQGAAMAMSLTLIVLRSRDAHEASRLAAMSQCGGYMFAAAGPFLMGLVADATGGWAAPLLVILATIPLQWWAGLGAGRDRYVGSGGGPS